MIDKKIIKQIHKMIGNNKNFWSVFPILEHEAQYNMIFGERSNGKTYGVLEFALCYHLLTGRQIGMIRRYEADFDKRLAGNMWTSLRDGGENKIKKYTDGKWESVEYENGAWYLSRYRTVGKGKPKLEKAQDPFCLAFPLTQTTRFKSTQYPNIDIILFDEFLTRTLYLPDEFILFQEVCSTIIRDRDNVVVFMLGNTVNKYCPYFDEMGLSHIKDMPQGTIDIYRYGDTELTVAVEYCEHIRSKDSDSYFAFDNPRLQMVTGGKWEISVYPHCPCKYKPKDVIGRYFIEFHGDLLEAEIVMTDEMLFTFIHKKTTPLSKTNTDLVFTPEYSAKPNYRRRITQPKSEAERKIYDFFVREKVFYSDNPTGEIVRNYLLFCKQNDMTRS